METPCPSGCQQSVPGKRIKRTRIRPSIGCKNRWSHLGCKLGRLPIRHARVVQACKQSGAGVLFTGLHCTNVRSAIASGAAGSTQDARQAAPRSGCEAGSVPLKAPPARLTSREQQVRVALGRHVVERRVAEHVAVRLLQWGAQATCSGADKTQPGAPDTAGRCTAQCGRRAAGSAPKH